MRGSPAPQDCQVHPLDVSPGGIVHAGDGGGQGAEAGEPVIHRDAKTGLPADDNAAALAALGHVTGRDAR